MARQTNEFRQWTSPSQNNLWTESKRKLYHALYGINTALYVCESLVYTKKKKKGQHSKRNKSCVSCKTQECKKMWTTATGVGKFFSASSRRLHVIYLPQKVEFHTGNRWYVTCNLRRITSCLLLYTLKGWCFFAFFHSSQERPPKLYCCICDSENFYIGQISKTLKIKCITNALAEGATMRDMQQ